MHSFYAFWIIHLKNRLHILPPVKPRFFSLTFWYVWLLFNELLYVCCVLLCFGFLFMFFCILCVRLGALLLAVGWWLCSLCLIWFGVLQRNRRKVTSSFEYVSLNFWYVWLLFNELGAFFVCSLCYVVFRLLVVLFWFRFVVPLFCHATFFGVDVCLHYVW